MSRTPHGWDEEIERRIRVYEEIHAQGKEIGRIGIGDYLALSALCLLLVGGFWSWGAL